MNRIMTLALACMVALGISVTVVGAAEGKTQTKTGTVKRVDVEAKQIVVMAARELTFTITDSTKIQQGGKPATLSDIMADASVAVEYVKDGDKRTATQIVLPKGR